MFWRTVLGIGGFFWFLSSVAWGGETIWWENGMIKLRAANAGSEGDPIPKNADLCHGEKCLKGGIRISAAQNEFEPFQIFIAASAEEEVKGVDITVSDLVNGLHRISSRLPGPVMIYREHYIRIEKPTTPEAKRGAWPDALIPKVDEYLGERRSMPDEGRPAFPFDVPRGQKRGVWVDLYIPPDMPAGIYTGLVTVRVGERKGAVIPIELTVYPFSLPFTSSLRTAGSRTKMQSGLLPAGIKEKRESNGSFLKGGQAARRSIPNSLMVLIAFLAANSRGLSSPPSAFATD